MIRADACIVGAGAGGIGCAYRLIKEGASVVIVDKNPGFGGTMVFSGVDGWEPGVSLDGLHTLICKELEGIPLACHVTEVIPNLNIFDRSVGRDWEKHSFSERPWSFSAPMGDAYETTLGRCLSIRGENGAMKRFQFDSDMFNIALGNIFAPYRENLKTFFGYSYVSCTKEDGRIVSITVSDGGDEIKICADYFIDASGDIVLARDAGCAYTVGTESRDAYGEPSAPDKASKTVNAVTYVFRISKSDDPSHIDPLPEWVKSTDLGDWEEKEMRRCVSFTAQYPNGDVNFNMLPTMQGSEYFSLGESADTIGHARVYKYWSYLQNEKNMKGYTLKRIFNAGIRESYRLVGRYVLREQDLRAGGPISEDLIGRTVAVADHAMDIHGKSGMCKELNDPYKIPVECTMTNEFDNLFVACRGASFTHIAASSARLSRTMLSLGEGVGEYIAELIRDPEIW